MVKPSANRRRCSLFFTRPFGFNYRIGFAREAWADTHVGMCNGAYVNDRDIAADILKALS